MAQQDLRYTIGIDASGAIAGLGAFVGSISNQNDALKSAIVTMIDYNRQLNQLEATIVGRTLKGSTVTAKTPFNPATGRASGGLIDPQVSSEFDKSITGAERFQAVLDKGFNVASVQLLKKAVNDVVVAFAQGVRDAIQFSVSISEIRTISQDANITFGQWVETIRGLSDKFGKPQTDVAEAAYQALSNQVIKGREAFNFLNTALEFGQVTQTSATDSVNLLSSAITGFGRNSSEADAIAAGLFKTIEIGRVRGSEMANTFGRIAPIAHTLGVSLEEVEASITVLTRQGTKFADASTLITNVLTKLTKPTAEMKKLLDGWGTPTGEAAIATFGFAGVLEKLQEASKGSVTELATLFNDIRGLKGAAGLTLFSGFDEDLGKIQAAEDSYKRAKDIIKESPGQELLIEFNKIKNFFVDDLGISALGTIAKITNSIVSLSDIVKGATAGVLLFGSAFVIYKVSTTAATYASTLFVTQQSSMVAAMAGSTVAASQLSIAIQGAVPVIGVALVAWAAYSYAMQDVGANALRTSETIKQVSEEINNSRSFVNANQINQFKSGLDVAFKGIGNVIAGELQKANDKLVEMQDNTKKFGDALSINFRSVTDSINEGIKDISRHIAEARNVIKESEKDVVNFRAKGADTVFATLKEYATPQQQISLLDDRIAQLRKQAKAQFATNDKDEIQSARKKYDEILKLAKEQFDIQQNLRKQFAQANGFGAIGVDVTDLKSFIGSLAREYDNLNKQVIDGQKKQIDNLTVIEEKEKSRVRAFEKAAKEFLELQKQISEGTLDKNKLVLGKDGKVDIDKVSQQIQERATNLVTLGGPNAAALLDFYKNLWSQMYNLRDTARAGQYKKELEGEQKHAQDIYKAAKEAANAYDKAASDAVQGIFGDGKALDTIGKKLKDFRDALNIEGPTWKRDLAAINPLNLFNGASDNIIKANPARDATQKALQELEKIIAELNNSNVNLKDNNVVDAYRKRIDELRATLTKAGVDLDLFIKKSTGNENANLANTLINGNDPNPRNRRTFQELLDSSFKQIDAMKDYLDKVQETRQNFEKLSNAPADIIKNSSGALRDAFDKMLSASTDAKSQVTDDFGTVGVAIDGVMQNINRLSNALDNLKAKGVFINIDANIGNAAGAGGEFGGGKASGGYIFGPRGEDNIAAWLKRGEFVMTTEATNRFRPILEAMNSGNKPGYYSQGGYVTTNVGDIHISQVSSGNADVDVRRLGRELQRQLRRGTVKLN